MSDSRHPRARAVLLTPPGRGAVALIAVTGDGAAAVVGRLMERGAPPELGRMRHLWLRGPDGDPLDDALVVGIPPEAAVSGEPTWELGVHGGPAVVEAVLAALEAAGARRSEWRHLLESGRRHGELDPMRAAAMRRVGRTVSRRGAEVLAFALTGTLQAKVRAAVAASDPARFEALDRAGARARAWLAPLRVTLVGPPNAGKSTLFNALLGWNRATVSGEAGTTRDAVEEDLLVEDEPIRLVDTAGHARDPITLARVRRSDLVLMVEDGAETGATACDPAVAGQRSLRVVNKIDRMSPAAQGRIPAGAVGVSAREGRGMDALLGAIRAAVGRGEAAGAAEPALFTRTDCRLLARVRSGGPDAARARAELARRADAPRR